MATISNINMIIFFAAMIFCFFAGAWVFREGTKISFLKEKGYFPVESAKVAQKDEEPVKPWDDV